MLLLLLRKKWSSSYAGNSIYFLMFGDNAPDGYRLVGYGLDGITELWLHPADFDQLATPLQQGN